MSFSSCDRSGNATTWTWTDLRIAPVFAIWIAGTLSAAFPILSFRSPVTRVPRTLFEYAFPLSFLFRLSQLTQVRQISRFWCHYRRGICPPPSPRH